MKMKHYVSAAVLALAFSACSDDYDDSALWDAVNDNTQRIEALEAWQDEVNGNIAALQQLLNTTDYITSVTPLTENGEEVGYVIEFHNSDPITIRHGAKGDKGDKGDQGEQGEQGPQGEPGKDGEDGADGSDGEDGSTPVIGLTQGEDGNWYWTLNGELMRDPNGDPIRANGEKGEQGNKGESGEDGDDGTQGIPGTPAPTPQIKLGSTLTSGTYYGIDGNKQADADDTAWYLSVDDGATWYRISGNKGDKGDTGATGPQGPQGDKGDTGEQGDKGEQGEQGEQGDSWFAKAPELSDDGTHYIFTLTEKDKDGNNLTIEVPAYQGTLKIGDGTGTLILENVETTIDITLPTGTKAADYTALVAQITPEGADGTYTDIDSRAGDAVGGWSVTATLAESSSVTIKTTQAGTALLRVTLIRTDGSELTASCAVHSQGYKVENNTYTVYTAEGLLAWAEAARKDLSTSCTLAANLDLTGTEWTPVGKDYDNPYTGTFDGAGHTLTRLTNQSEANYIGLFGAIGEGGTVKNLRLTSVAIKGNNWVGAVAGSNSGIIENCSAAGEITGSSGEVGGIAGVNDGIITNCSAASSVTGDRTVGGITGYQFNGTTTGCSATAEITGSGECVGGIIGYQIDGTTADCHSSATVKGRYKVGGVIGQIETENKKAVLIACSSTGDVTSTSNTSYSWVGGVMGAASRNSSIIACYSTGKVTGSRFTGGVAGGHSGSITACYWSGENTNGVGGGESSGATKVENDITWQTAAGEMNKALAENGYSNYQWEENNGVDKETRPLILVRN